MYQFYVVEIQKYQNGEFGHIVHYAYDENIDKAQRKAESKYHEILSSAAVSDARGIVEHSAILFTSEGFPTMHQCYKHELTATEETAGEE